MSTLLRDRARSAFPLPRLLGGTSARVTVGATSVDLILVYVLATQVAAILPSNTPLGGGTLAGTFNNQTSATLAIRVGRGSFGIFTLNQAGSGPGILTDPDFVVNTLFRPAAPGSVWILWGTGLGPVSGDEAAGPLPGDLADIDVIVLVGGRRARILYRGRSGCCAGIDQIVIEIPPDVAGCYVPLVVVINGVPSNFTTMTIAPEGASCTEPGGLTAGEMTAAQGSDSFRVGAVALSRTEQRLGALNLPIRTDTASAGFGRFDAARLIAARNITGVSHVGGCAVFRFRGLEAADNDPVRPDPLDAGAALNLTGPRGARQVPRRTPGIYQALVGGGAPSIPGLPAGIPEYLAAGSYTVNNGAGAGVGPFTATLAFPAPLIWANQNVIAAVTRAQGVTITWSGGGAGEFVQITGSSVAAAARAGAGFVCRERVSAGTFAVPAEVLGSLPAGPDGLLSVGTISDPVRFTATGLDLGLFYYTVLLTRTVVYQ
jgi:uncharacterized protein (TIGR03437 family)